MLQMTTNTQTNHIHKKRGLYIMKNPLSSVFRDSVGIQVIRLESKF